VTDVEVKMSSIQGLGVFAARPFRAGERIRRVNIVREVTPDSPLREDAGERIEHCGYPDGKIVLWGFPDRHVNHRCDPNVYEFYQGEAVYIVARRDIAPGEEITFDYNINTSGGNSWPCECGAVRCRGESIGDFFSLPEEHQRESLPCLAGWFVESHRERLEALDPTHPAGGQSFEPC
jgi:SET domain-containing protein